MRRSRALAPLSRDHHHALVVATRLRRVTPFTAESARDAFLAYWNQEGHEHLREEEEILLPAYGRHANPHHPLIARVLCEHITIRALACAVGETSPPIATLQELGLALSDHVRLEERSLFPLIEETVPPAELERLAAQLSHAQA
jgi:iron-sulfur cluster repair protein YtfE (RIC family)